MSKHVLLGPIADIPPGEGRTYAVGKVSLAVFRTRQGRVFATQGECPHRGGPLADGLVGGTTLVCPLHEWSFDLLSGMALNGQCGIRVYPVRQEADGTVAVEMEEDGSPPPFRHVDYTKEAPRS
jgi:nitrite reductase (NADH) small subunit